MGVKPRKLLILKEGWRSVKQTTVPKLAGAKIGVLGKNNLDESLQVPNTAGERAAVYEYVRILVRNQKKATPTFFFVHCNMRLRAYAPPHIRFAQTARVSFKCLGRTLFSLFFNRLRG